MSAAISFQVALLAFKPASSHSICGRPRKAVSALSLVCRLVLVAATWMFPITGLVGGILCELCLRAGQFRQKGWLMLGFFCFNLGFIGDFLPLWFTKESYLEYAAQMMDAGYMATMEGLLTWPVFGVIVLSILAGSVLGSLLGMKLMRKHFVKAGLAQ